MSSQQRGLAARFGDGARNLALFCCKPQYVGSDAEIVEDFSPGVLSNKPTTHSWNPPVSL